VPAHGKTGAFEFFMRNLRLMRRLTPCCEDGTTTSGQVIPTGSSAGWSSMRMDGWRAGSGGAEGNARNTVRGCGHPDGWIGRVCAAFREPWSICRMPRPPGRR